MKAAKLIFSFFAALVALQVVYPWRIYYGEFLFSWATTLASYVILAAVMAGLGALAAPRFVNKFSSAPARSLKHSLLVALTCFSLLILLTIVFSGPGLFLNVPGTRIRGIFFAEWRFAGFLLEIGVPFSVLVAVVDRWKRR